MDSCIAAKWIVLVLGALLGFSLNCSADSVHIYSGQFDLRIPAKPADPKEPDSRGWMDDAVIEIPDHLTISDLDVRINLRHTNVIDLQIFLQSLTGKTICLNMFDVSYLDKFPRDENYKDFKDTVFDDEAQAFVKEGEAPFTGRFKPIKPYKLSTFDGEDAYGTWRLRVYDAFWADTGTFNRFELMITAVELPSLSVLQPNGGETLIAGSTYTISWASTGSVSHVLLEYSVDNGATWAPVDGCDTGQAGSYDWKVPAVDSNQCLVRVTDVNDLDLSDMSHSIFAIQPPMVAVPNVVGMAQADAASAIISAGLVVGVITQQHSDILPPGYVLSQSPGAAVPVIAESPVDLVLSCDPPGPVVPPKVMTLAPTNVGRTAATLRGLVLDDGGEPCQYRFSYWKFGYYCCTGWSDPANSKASGQLFCQQQTALTAGAYYFTAQAKNSGGESEWGGLQTFTIRGFTGRGGGTQNDPYIITNVYELQQIERGLTACYELASDIDASVTANWNDRYGFTPIGRYTAPFEGVFDGKGHVITGLDVNRPCICVGLFGCTGGTSEIRNLGLSDVTVTGYACVGGLVGFNGGAIEACYVSGNVSGSTQVGGLVGTNNGLVTDSYSVANVSGPQQESCIGGLVGVNRGILENCYSAGNVSGEKSAGLAGTCSGRCAGCFWDIETSGRVTSACGIGKATAEMQTWATFAVAGWSAKGGWTICEHVDYPKLAWQIRPGDEFCPDGVDMVDFAIFAARWKAGNPDSSGDGGDSADFNQSGTVNAADLEILTSTWLTSGR